ncbi:hypothetical protein [Ornithobacterium rhinotracheale]|uniref:hypothetical protein n=1 Tax=Ornithobacterium rhinotracheale TaxID=28251 RepID=UPI001FF5B504|nr:hypothetical protein [Ornithobacterium rhinotracheale]MCK0202692.1 hypothetical protein [Ornithobacterium rhinotracheale]
MEVKKSQNANVQKSSMLYFLIGLNVVLLAILLMFNYKQYDEALVKEEEFAEVEAPTEAVLVEIPEPKTPPPPPPKADEPPPPPPPVVPQEIEQSPKPVPPPPIQDQNTPTPPKINLAPSHSTGEVKKVDLSALKQKTQEAPKEERVAEAVTVNRVDQMAVYPGCEKYRGKKRELIKCFGEKLGDDILKYLNTEFPDVNKESVGVRLEFHVDENGYITNINPKFGDDIFKPEAKRALEKAADYLRRKGQTIEPARMSDGSKVKLIFTQPVSLRNPNY